MSGPLTRFGFAEETPEQRQEKILAGVMASVYRQVPQSVLVSIVGAFALIMVLWNSIEQICCWAVRCLSAESLCDCASYKIPAPSTLQSRSTVGYALGRAGGGAGLLWGVAGLCFSPTTSRCIRSCWSRLS